MTRASAEAGDPAGRDTSAFTLVFEGDIRQFDFNPFKTETPFGKPTACGFGNAFDRVDVLTEALEAFNTAYECEDDSYADKLNAANDLMVAALAKAAGEQP